MSAARRKWQEVGDISRDVAKALKWDENLKKEALHALRDNDLGRLIQALDKAETFADKKHKPAVDGVRNPVLSNWEYIIDFRLRLKALGYECETFRGLGSGESNVRNSSPELAAGPGLPRDLKPWESAI